MNISFFESSLESDKIISIEGSCFGRCEQHQTLVIFLYFLASFFALRFCCRDDNASVSCSLSDVETMTGFVLAFLVKGSVLSYDDESWILSDSCKMTNNLGRLFLKDSADDKNLQVLFVLRPFIVLCADFMFFDVNIIYCRRDKR
jgi:hypothetical protein